MNTESPSRVNLIARDIDFLLNQAAILKAAGWAVFTYLSIEEFFNNHDWKTSGCAILLVEPDDFDPWRLSLTLKDQDIEFPVIYIGKNASIYMAVDAMKNGASNFLSYPVRNERLLEAVKEAIKKNRNQRNKRLLIQKCRDLVEQLTKTEKIVLESFCGKSRAKDVANQFGMSERTVRQHCRSINQKFETRNIVEAVRILLLSK